MSKNVNLDTLNEHLFDVIERLKESNDPDSDTKDGIDLEIAAKICEASKIIVESYKVKVQVLNIAAKCGNNDMVARFTNNSGTAVIPEKTESELNRERERNLYK
jgi:hypothetical protein